MRFGNVFDAFLYVKKTIISQFFLGSRPLWLLSKLLQVQPPVSRADFASVEAYIKHLELQIEYGHIVGKKRDLGILDPMIFSGKIRKNTPKIQKNTEKSGKYSENLEKYVKF